MLAINGPSPITQVKKWSATVVANVLSTYALDTVCTVAGVLLVASGLFADTGLPFVLTLLGCSYVLWGAGLSSSLEANWRLLEATGTSTSLLSKLAYDLAGSRTSGRVRRVLCASGYVAFELAKESPYYLGAFGLAFASDAVSSEEAIIFLAGANIGAAAYEYGLSWSTRILLRKTGQPAYSSFEREWVPKAYLANYYNAVDADEQHTIAFFAEAGQRMPPDEPVLVFGAGPTLHHVFLLAKRASEIHLGDYLRSNLDEIARWIRGESGAHDWQAFVRHTLQCEGVAEPALSDILERQHLTRGKISELMEVDVRHDRPLGPAQTHYATVVSAYCACSATADFGTWQVYMRRIMSLVRPGGTLLVAALRGTHSYFIDGKAFPSPCIDEEDMREILLEDFPKSELTVRVVRVPECATHGYSSIILASGHCRRAEPAKPAAKSGAVSPLSRSVLIAFSMRRRRVSSDLVPSIIITWRRLLL